MYNITRTWSAARHQPDLRQISVTVRRDTMVDAADPDVPSGVLTRCERIGWYAYDFANSAFHQATGAVFAPLLLDALATDRAWKLAGETSPSACDDASDPSTATGCYACVRGLGTRIITSRNPFATEAVNTPKLPGGMAPTSFVFAAASASVLIQAVTFITLGSFGNYGTNRRRWMKLASYVGWLSNVLLVIVPVSNALYWLGGLLYVVANVALGVSVVFYNSYLPGMVERTGCVRNAIEAKKLGERSEEELNAVVERVTNELSSVGQGWGYVGGTSALILGLTAVMVSGAVGASTEWSLGIGCAITGAWWGIFAEVAFKMMPDTPGRVPPTGGLSLLHGWRNTASVLHKVWTTDRPSAYYLIMFFFFSDGYSTMTTVSLLFASRDMCMGLLSLMILSVLVPLFAGVGNFVWLRAQRKAQWTTKQTLVINLLALGALLLWGCIGFFTSSIGLQQEAELYALAILFGCLLGSTQAYARAQFTELIPEGHESDMFALFEITDKGSSWLGPLVAAAIVHATDTIRPMLIYLACELIIPALVISRLNMKQAERTGEI